MSEAEKLTAFLLALQTSPTEREQFMDDPLGEMLRFNLSVRTMKAVIAAVKRDQPEDVWRILRVPAIRTHVGKAAWVEMDRRKKK